MIGEAGTEEDLGRAVHVGALAARILRVKLVACEKWAGTVGLAGGAAGTWAAEGRGDGSYATGFGFYPVGRREPSKVIGQGLTGLERHFMEMTLAAGAWAWRPETVTLEVRAVARTGKGTDSSQT